MYLLLKIDKKNWIKYNNFWATYKCSFSPTQKLQHETTGHWDELSLLVSCRQAVTNYSFFPSSSAWSPRQYIRLLSTININILVFEVSPIFWRLKEFGNTTTHTCHYTSHLRERIPWLGHSNWTSNWSWARQHTLVIPTLERLRQENHCRLATQ